MARNQVQVRNVSAPRAPVPPLPSPSPKSDLTDVDIAKFLTTLYQSTSFQSYACYFYLSTVSAVNFLSCTGGAMEKPDQPATYDKYSASYPVHFALNVEYVSSLGQSKVFAKAGAPWQVFVKLDNFGLLLPFQTASTVALTFVKGMVTRLILEKYNQLWKSINITVPSLPLAPPTSPPPPAPPALTVDTWAKAYLTSLSTELSDFTKWNQWPVQDYSQCLSNMTDASLQVAGISLGWFAADELISATDTATISAIWSLLNARYTTAHLGAMVGYVFCYLTGYLQNERIAKLVQGAKDPGPQGGPAALPTIWSNLGINVDNTSVSGSYNQATFDMSNRFYQLVVGEFYSITQNKNYLPPAPSTSATDALASYQAFIVGFERGMTLGADVLFTDLYIQGWNAGEQFGYDIGYSNGFRDGYSQGYAAGWQAGYTSYQQTASTWMGGLSNIFGGLGTLLGGSTGGELTTILSDATTVGQAIASIFSL